MLIISRIPLTLDKEAVIELPDGFKVLGGASVPIEPDKILSSEHLAMMQRGVKLLEPVVFISHDSDALKQKYKLLLTTVKLGLPDYKQKDLTFFYMLKDVLPDGRDILGFFFLQKLNP